MRRALATFTASLFFPLLISALANSALIISGLVFSALTPSTARAESETSNGPSPSSEGQRSWKVELRSPLGVLLTQPTRMNEGISEKLSLRELLTFGADLLVGENGWYGGVRFDSVQSAQFEAQNLYEVAAQLFSVMGQRRFDHAPWYWAPTLTIGVYTPSVVNLRSNGIDTIQYRANEVRTATIGIEGGWISDVYLLAFEAGFQYLHLADFSGSDGSRFIAPTGLEREANFNGPYLKFVLGLHL